MSVSGLGYVALNVVELDAWLELASKVFGMEIIRRKDSDAVDLRIDELHHRFTLYPAASNSIAAVGWEVDSEAKLQALVHKLTDYGVDLTEATAAQRDERKVRKLYSFIDPTSGVPSEIFFSPQSEMYPFQPSRRLSGYKTEGMGLGHVVYVVEDPVKSRNFYTEVMGFAVSDYISWDDIDATFYHCNPRHHSLAIMNTFGPFKAGDLNHIMIEANNLDDVGYAFDLVREMKVPLVMDMGKHTNDHMQSFYLETPSGFAIEYGYGAREIGQDWKVRTYDSPKLWGHNFPQKPT